MAPSGRLTAGLVVAFWVLALIGGALALAVAPSEATTPGQPRALTATTSSDGSSVLGAADFELGSGGRGHSSIEVVFSPRAAAWPTAEEIGTLLQRYFASINNLDYDAWLTTVSTSQALRDRSSWMHDYSTTTDVDIYISDIEQTEDGLQVRMQFTSYQDAEFAPPQLPEECVRWDVTYFVVDEGTGLRVDLSAQRPALAACD